jgi:hypothetical protein
MKQWLGAALLSALAMVTLSCGSTADNDSRPDARPAAAAADPNPAMQDPDQVAWRLFVEAVAPGKGAATTFETWATDADTFNPDPKFPTGRSASLHARVIPALARARGNLRAVRPHLTLEASGIKTLEDVHRNEPTFKFIKDNELYKISGLVAHFGENLQFPKDSVEIKTNWVAVADIPAFTNGKVTPDQVGQYFYVSKDNSNAQWALVAMHVISKEVPNWTWATFESRWNPARCDIIGCHDVFGATVADVPPNPQPNQGYGACDKTDAVTQMFKTASVGAVFANYCLKGSQIDFIDNTGLAIRLGNSVTEAGQVQNSSCMRCHGQASWDKTGSPTGFDFAIGPIDPTVYWQFTGGPPYAGMPGMTRVATSADFVWAIPFCAGPPYQCAPATPPPAAGEAPPAGAPAAPANASEPESVSGNTG